LIVDVSASTEAFLETVCLTFLDWISY